MKNILHISDLHLSTSKSKGFQSTELKKLLDSILGDLNSSSFEEPIDTIFFTGDLSFSGKEDELIEVRQKFIEPLLSNLSLTFNDLYIVPGNHDVSRDKIGKIEERYRNKADDVELLELSIEVNESKQDWVRTENYLAFQSSIYEEVENIVYLGNLVNVRRITKNLNVFSVNSAWLAQGDEDKGNLSILNQLEFTLKKFGKNSTNIVLFHHPTDWIKASEQLKVSREIERNVHALFFGHMHEFEQSVTINFSQDITLRLQAGTLDLRNDRSGYSVIQLHSKNNFSYGRAIYRKYSKDNDCYEPWEERGEGGICDFSIDKTQVFDAQKFSQLSSELKERVELGHIVNTGKEGSELKSLQSIFIEPRFEKSGLANDQANVRDVNSLSDLLDKQGCVLVSGSDQNGKSFLLKYIQVLGLTKQASSDLRNIVYYLNLGRVKFTKKSQVLIELISDYMGHELMTSFDGKVRKSFKDGNAKILIDNYDKGDEQSISFLNEFIKENSNNTFIISCNKSCSMDTLSNLSHTYEGDIYTANLSPIVRDDIRKIISSRPELSKAVSEDEIYHHIIRVVDSSQLSHNHFVYSILLAIYENKKELVGILSESDIIENYIEILLDKHGTDASPDKPQYQDLKHLMGYLSSKMLVSKNGYLNKNDFLGQIIEFDKETLNNYQVEDYTQPLFKSGLLIERSNNTVEFSNICFLHYFIAYFIQTDKELHDLVFSNDNYLHLEKVVEYYSSQNSSSFDVLEFLEKKVDGVREQLTESIKEVQKIDIDSLDLNDLKSTSILDLASSTDEFENKINEYKADRQRFDQQQDQISPLADRKPGPCELKNLNSDFADSETLKCSSSRYKKELVLFSKVFRSTELLMNRERVLEIFGKILDSYIFLIKADISLLDDNFVLPMILPRIEEEFLSEDLSDSEREKTIDSFRLFLSVIRATIPNVVENVMSDSLATKKPRFKKILETKLSGVEEEIEILLLRFLLLEIDRKDIKQNISQLVEHPGKFAANALFLKFGQILMMRHDLSEDDQKFIKSKIVKLIKSNKEIRDTGFDKLLSMLKSKEPTPA
ncbi:hypothetical protein A3758_13755 [Oleiphilus sp. HI0118]|nr:hypothetical protein A3758_13755 [Oleiphilus sp. HI0118]